MKILKRLKAKIHRYREHFWAKKDASSILSHEKVLFIDLGSNLGQGYKWFKQYYNDSKIKFELFEPNPYCCDELLKLPDIRSGNVSINNCGVGTNTGIFNLYGLNSSEGGKFAQGGSIIKEHNSKIYDLLVDNAIQVNVIDFSDYLKNISCKYQKIIVKMDIEGAEVDLLEHLIKEKTIGCISILYVEFHSQYQTSIQSKITKARELKILKSLYKRNDLKVRIWH